MESEYERFLFVDHFPFIYHETADLPDRGRGAEALEGGPVDESRIVDEGLVP